jgi:hypothetical protein
VCAMSECDLMYLWIEICVLLGYYAALNGNPLPTFRDNISVSYSGVKKPKKKIKLSRNVGKGLPFDAA